VRQCGLNDKADTADTALALVIGALCLIVGLIAMVFAVDAEQRSRGDVATPVTADDAD
jgi:hypothetical protein